MGMQVNSGSAWTNIDRALVGRRKRSADSSPETHDSQHEYK